MNAVKGSSVTGDLLWALTENITHLNHMGWIQVLWDIGLQAIFKRAKFRPNLLWMFWKSNEWSHCALITSMPSFFFLRILLINSIGGYSSAGRAGWRLIVQLVLCFLAPHPIHVFCPWAKHCSPNCFQCSVWGKTNMDKTICQMNVM